MLIFFHKFIKRFIHFHIWEWIDDVVDEESGNLHYVWICQQCGKNKIV